MNPRFSMLSLSLPTLSTIGLASLLLMACSSSMPDNPVEQSGEALTAHSQAPWCNSSHTADDEEGDFNGFGGRGCSDPTAKAECGQLGGSWCKGYVDNQTLLCACKDTSAKVKTCSDVALASGHLQPGASGGPDARGAISCESGYTLCRIDPQGKDNDVCSDADDCYACSR
jgi:hypothetical protein